MYISSNEQCLAYREAVQKGDKEEADNILRQIRKENSVPNDVTDLVLATKVLIIAATILRNS